MRIEETPHRYVAGEESALVHWINGGEAKPTFVPPRPFERGVRGRPTLVDNVETLAHFALIARFGPDLVPTRWARPPTPAPGSLTITGAVAVPGVYEMVGRIVDQRRVACRRRRPGGHRRRVVRWLLRYVDPERRPSEPHVGSRVLGRRRFEPRLRGAVRATRRRMRLGRVGTRRPVAGWPERRPVRALRPRPRRRWRAAWTRLVDGRHTHEAWEEVGRLMGLVEGRGACRHPDGVVRFVLSSLAYVPRAHRAPRRTRSLLLPPRRCCPTPAIGGWR